MTIFGWHASHEQIPPSRLLAAAQMAEEVGFDAGMSSDHFSPWNPRQGESGFAWSWLGAALQATSLPFGVVNAPGQRYHPAIIAQAAATLTEMFPGRLWVALGSGEASNEHITGDGWPAKPVRERRLRECVDVMRALFAGEEVNHDGLVTVDRARLWTLPAAPPPLIGAAVSVETARWVGEWADGLVTIKQPREHLERMLDAFRDNGGAGKPVYLQVHVSWAPNDDEALAIAYDQWRSNVFAPPLCWDLDHVDHFEEASKHVRPEHLRASVEVSSDLGHHVGWLHDTVEMGFDGVWIHHVGKEQRAFLEAFGHKVLPQIKSSDRSRSNVADPGSAKHAADLRTRNTDGEIPA
jgi:probable non-F420 flavinoid oxidoreductase